jgi:hypothetical protein
LSLELVVIKDFCINYYSINNIEYTNIYTHNDKKLFVKRIGDIKNKKCYLKIFKIIHGDNFKYTKNDNGIFFNLTNLPDSILAKIETVLIYYENKTTFFFTSIIFYFQFFKSTKYFSFR